MGEPTKFQPFRASGVIVKTWPERSTSPLSKSAPRAMPLREWRALLCDHPNLLLEGPRSDLEETLVALAKDFYPRQRSWALQGFRDLPPSPPAEITIVVREVTALDAASLGGLKSWLESGRRRIQIVTTSSVPLFPLVEQRAFPADLYYRLNTIRFEL